MLERHVAIREPVFSIDDEDLDSYLLTQSQERKVDDLVAKLTELNEISVKLQSGKKPFFTLESTLIQFYKNIHICQVV